MSNYQIVIGLEVHVELKTETKAFCSCKNEFGGVPNTHCCPVCIGLPGALPVLNKTAVEYCIRAGLALGCKINPYATFERKNYFYPDLAKAYQISEAEYPICLGGGLEVSASNKARDEPDSSGSGNDLNKKSGDSMKFIRLNRIHLEEDAGKLVHDNMGTLVDYNRGGVPLIEIVTEPDMSGADEALDFLNKLKTAIIYTGVSDCKMQEGRLRCDVNVSVNKLNEPLGTRTEMKNLNSFSAVRRAINFESKRQIDELEKGNKIVQETRRWDDMVGKSYPMRSKEDAQDYRYFPDPDILPIEISSKYIEKIRKDLPEMPWQLGAKFIKEYGLSAYDAGLITSDKAYSDLFLGVLNAFNEPKFVLNFIVSEIFRKVNALGLDDVEIPLKSETLAKLLKLYHAKVISQATTRELLSTVWESNADPEVLVKEQNLGQVSDTGELEKILAELLVANPKAAEQLRAGDEKVYGFFIGQTMRKTGGKASASVVRDILGKLIK